MLGPGRYGFAAERVECIEGAGSEKRVDVDAGDDVVADAGYADVDVLNP